MFLAANRKEFIMGTNFGITFYNTTSYDFDEQTEAMVPSHINTYPTDRDRCINGSFICAERKQIVFWDEAANIELGNSHQFRESILVAKPNIEKDEDDYMICYGTTRLTKNQLATFLKDAKTKLLALDRHIYIKPLNWCIQILNDFIKDHKENKNNDVIITIHWG